VLGCTCIFSCEGLHVQPFGKWDGLATNPLLTPSGASLKPGSLFAEFGGAVDLRMAASEAYRCICTQAVVDDAAS